MRCFQLLKVRSGSLFRKAFLLISLSLLFSALVFAEAEIKKNIFFGYDSSALSADAKKVLDDYVQTAKQKTGSQIRITGYADSKGSTEYNRKLCEERVASVVDYITARGVDKRIIKTSVAGSTSKFSTGESESSLSKNRRVEIILTIKEQETKKPAAEPKPEPVKNIAAPNKQIKKISVGTEDVVSHELKKIAGEYIEIIIPYEIIKGRPVQVQVVVSNELHTKLLAKLHNNVYDRISPVNDIGIDDFDLTGAGFTINKTKGDTPGHWSWEVIPNKTGMNSVSVSADVNIKSGSSEHTVSMPLFIKGLDVKSSYDHYLSAIMSNGLIVAFLVVLALGIFTMISKKSGADNIKKE